MAADTDDPKHVNIYRIGDLANVDDATPVDNSTYVYDTTDSEWKVTAPDAAIPNAAGAPTQAEFNAVLAALRTHGIIAP